MNRRPWPLVVLAILYCTSPLLYPLFVSLSFGTAVSDVTREILAGNSPWRNVEVFLLPVLLGLIMLYARRWSYFAVLIGSLYLFARNSQVFVSANAEVPVIGIVTANLGMVAMMIYFLRRSTRAVYFNAKMRWWETDPRYVVGYEAKLGRIGGGGIGIRIRNIAIGGAAIETKEIGFLPDERVEVDFVAMDQSYSLAAAVVWEQTPAGEPRLIGIQWIEESQPKVRTLIRKLKKNRVPTTRTIDRWQDFKAWASRPENP